MEGAGNALWTLSLSLPLPLCLSWALFLSVFLWLSLSVCLCDHPRGFLPSARPLGRPGIATPGGRVVFVISYISSDMITGVVRLIIFRTDIISARVFSFPAGGKGTKCPQRLQMTLSLCGNDWRKVYKMAPFGEGTSLAAGISMDIYLERARPWRSPGGSGAWRRGGGREGRFDPARDGGRRRARRPRRPRGSPV